MINIMYAELFECEESLIIIRVIKISENNSYIRDGFRK